MSRGWLGLVAVGTTVLMTTVAPAAADSNELTEEQVGAAATAAIAGRSHDGVFVFDDPRSGERLSLVMDDVRVVRGLTGYGWFANVAFHDQATPAKTYTIDFWMLGKGIDLKPIAARIHKAPRPDGSGWMSLTRSPQAWWWLPTIKRQSAQSGMAAWQVMGRVHQHIAGLQRDGQIELPGVAGPVALVDVEQPVGRSKADGRYFACALLRMFGTDPVFYSTTYWVDGKTSLVTEGSVQRIKAPASIREKAATEPHCDVEGVAFDIVD